jgi:hypothetical protein
MTPIPYKYNDVEALKSLKNRKKDFPKKIWKWFTTISIEKDIEIDDKYFVQEYKSSWLNIEIIPDLTEIFRNEIEIYFDRIAIYLSFHMDKEFFQEKILSETFFKKRGFYPTSYYDGVSSVILSRSTEDLKELNIKGFKKIIKAIAKISNKDHERFDKTLFWYFSSKDETDRWKKFQWAFLGLEILINKLAKETYEKFISIDVEKSNLKILEEYKILLDNDNKIFVEYSDLNLVQKFILVTINLFGEISEENLKDFRKAKKARDNMSHGSINENDELPIPSVNKILWIYLQKSFPKLLEYII